MVRSVKLHSLWVELGSDGWSESEKNTATPENVQQKNCSKPRFSQYRQGLTNYCNFSPQRTPLPSKSRRQQQSTLGKLVTNTLHVSVRPQFSDFFLPGIPPVPCILALTSFFSLFSREELQDVAENEIESNWDQVVDKWGPYLCDHDGPLSDIGPASTIWNWRLNYSEAFTLTGEWENRERNMARNLTENATVSNAPPPSSSVLLFPLWKDTTSLRRPSLVLARPPLSPFPFSSRSVEPHRLRLTWSMHRWHDFFFLTAGYVNQGHPGPHPRPHPWAGSADSKSCDRPRRLHEYWVPCLCWWNQRPWGHGQAPGGCSGCRRHARTCVWYDQPQGSQDRPHQDFLPGWGRWDVVSWIQGSNLRR